MTDLDDGSGRNASRTGYLHVTGRAICAIFRSTDADLRAVSLANERGKRHVVLYFYPKDDTSGCTLEALDFTMLADEFERADCVVFGVSRDDCVSHAAFRDKHGLSVQLLADMDGEVCEQYGVWQEKEKDVSKKWYRAFDFRDRQSGVIRHALYGVTAKGHAAAVWNWCVRLIDAGGWRGDTTRVLSGRYRARRTPSRCGPGPGARIPSAPLRDPGANTAITVQLVDAPHQYTTRAVRGLYLWVGRARQDPSDRQFFRMPAVPA